MSAEQSTFWNNLLSGFIGSLIGSGISLVAVFLQNKHASKLQEEALRLERKIAEETSFLDRAYKAMQSGKWALLKYGSKAWEDKAGDPAFTINLSTFKIEIFNVIDELVEAVEYFSFLDKRVKKYPIRLHFKEELERAIKSLWVEFRPKFSLPEDQKAFNTEELKIVKPKFESVNKLIDEFESWLRHNVILIMEQRREILAIEK